MARGRQKVIIKPASEPVTVDEVKLYTRIPHTVEDSLISIWIEAARKAAEDYQHRTYVTQTWTLFFDRFPGSCFLIPRPPLISIESIKYYDTDNVETEFDSSNYFVDTTSEVGRVSLNFGGQWPAITLRPINGVMVTFVCGYGAALDVPDDVKEAIMLYCAWRYENRTAEAGELPRNFYDILNPDKLAVY